MSFLKFQSDRHLQAALKDIDTRLLELEKRVLKTARKDTTTKGQQLLLFKQLGLLEKLAELKLSGNKKAKLLSVLLNANKDNIEGDLNNLNKTKSSLRIVENYKFLVKTYKEVGLKILAEMADAELDKIQVEEITKHEQYLDRIKASKI